MRRMVTQRSRPRKHTNSRSRNSPIALSRVSGISSLLRHPNLGTLARCQDLLPPKPHILPKPKPQYNSRSRTRPKLLLIGKLVSKWPRWSQAFGRMTVYQKSYHSQTTVYRIVGWTTMGYEHYASISTEKSVASQWTRKLSLTNLKERGEKVSEPTTTG
jgi:hypothetical protein